MLALALTAACTADPGPAPAPASASAPGATSAPVRPSPTPTRTAAPAVTARPTPTPTRRPADDGRRRRSAGRPAPGRRHRPPGGDLAELRRGRRPRRAAVRGARLRVRRPTVRRAGRQLLGHTGPRRHLAQRDRRARSGSIDEQPHVVVGAHLDTVPVAPGAEDNASGVAVLLELARMAARAPPDLRCSSSPSGRRSPAVPATPCTTSGPRSTWPICRRRTPGDARDGVPRPGRGAGRLRAGLPDRDSGTTCGPTSGRPAARAASRPGPARNTASDHWSYVKAGMPGVRLGSIPYAGYHSRGDTPVVVDRRQLDRVGTRGLGLAAESVTGLGPSRRSGAGERVRGWSPTRRRGCRRPGPP